MPKIFEYFGFIFYFYSNEHEPIHVHVIHGARESIFDLIMMDGVLNLSSGNITRTLSKSGLSSSS